MIVNRVKAFLFFISPLLFVATTYAQFNYKIDGVVKENGKFLSGAIVTIYNFNSEKIKEIITPSTGTFSFSLKPDEEYNILITKEGYNTVKLIYSTIGMTDEEAKKIKATSNPELEIFPLPQEPKLLAKINELASKPMMSLYYSTDDKKMVSDDDVLNSMKEELTKLQAAAFEEKNKDAIAAQKDAKYTAAILKGDKDFAALNYKAAKDAYNEALAIKANEQYPKTKIAEADKLIAALSEKEKSAKEKELTDKYNAAISKADKALSVNDYTGAKLSYNEAATIKTTELYPKNKIKEIDTILADAAAKNKSEKEKLAKEKEVNDKYTAAITKADAAFFIKDYKTAKTAYNDALTVKPAEVYPQGKITEINKFLSDAEEKERIAKEKADADAAEKARLAKEKSDAEKAAKDKLEAEKAAADALLKEKIAKDKAIADAAAEKARIEKEAADAALAEKNKIAKEKAATEAAEADRIAKEKAAIVAAEKEKLAKEKAIADAAEKEKLAKEEEKRTFERKYKKIIEKADSSMTAKNYDYAKVGYNEALKLKPDDEYPKAQLKRADVLIAEAELYKNDLAKKYPIGVTEEVSKDGNMNVTKRIVVIGNKGYLYEKKETNFGATYYFKDGIAINQQQFQMDTQKK